MTPIVSVVMAFYNSELWLSEALDSVLSQDFVRWELLLVDDGSTDSSGQIADRYATNDGRIRKIAKDHSGLTKSLNIGLEHARGKWIARIDADDVWYAGKLSAQLGLIEAIGGVFVGSDSVTIDASGRQGRQNKYRTTHASLVDSLIYGRGFPAHSSALFLAEEARLLGGYRSEFVRAQDRDLWLRLSERGKIANVSRPLVGIRTHSGQISKTNPKQNYYSRLALTTYWLRRLYGIDPLNDRDQKSEFCAWVEKGIARDLSLDRLRELRRSAENLGTLRSIVTGHIGIAGALRLIHYRLAGDRLPEKLARAWVDKGHS